MRPASPRLPRDRHSQVQRDPGAIAIPNTHQVPFATSLAMLRTTQRSVQASKAGKLAPARLSRSLVAPIRAQEAAAAAPAAAEKPKWTEPTLNPDTPSPIFGGSTGGLLNAAKVRGPDPRIKAGLAGAVGAGVASGRPGTLAPTSPGAGRVRGGQRSAVLVALHCCEPIRGPLRAGDLKRASGRCAPRPAPPAAQTEEFYVITWESQKEQIFEMPNGGAAIMRKGPNLLKLAKKEQCLALTTQLRTKFKQTPCFYRVFPDGKVRGRARRARPGGRRVRAAACSSSREAGAGARARAPNHRRRRRLPPQVEYMHPKDGVYPEKVNAGRVGVNNNMR